jgi:hypothetical protein
MTISQWQDAMEMNVPACVLWQLQTLSIKGESEVLSLSKQMSMMDNGKPYGVIDKIRCDSRIFDSADSFR